MVGERPGKWRRGLVLAAAMVAVGLPAGAAGAAPAGAPKDPEKELARLEKKAAALSKEYRGELVALEEAKSAAQRAIKDSGRLEKEYTASRGTVSRLAAQSYISGGLDATIPLFTASDPGGYIRDAAVLEHLNRNNGRLVQQLQVLRARADQAERAAQGKLDEVRKQVDELEDERARVRKLLAKFKPETPSGPGRPDGVTGGKSPIVGNSMTARMRTALLAIDNKFGPFPTIGCYRSGDPQDHGTGTACDFMESTGGRMPSAQAQAHGDSVAQYVISNASRLGIKYVIWRQRIYDMRSGSGWKAMEDRGSVTANHYDHVHVSVL